MIHDGETVFIPGHGWVPLFDHCACDECQREPDYWVKEAHYETRGR